MQEHRNTESLSILSSVASKNLKLVSKMHFLSQVILGNGFSGGQPLMAGELDP